jgi:nucleolar pre-ribosomal-associated protein 1
MKEVIAAFRKIPDDYEHAMQRETATRLLRLYYEQLPLQALEEQFDVSTTLTSALVASETPAPRVPAELQALRSLELEHLLAIARYSTGMKWFHKQGGLSFTPIVTLLRIHRKEPKNRQMRALLEHVLSEHNVLETMAATELKATSLDAMMASILTLSDESPVWDFLDDCIGRATRKPIKYIDDLDEIDTSRGAVSLLVAVILEQASFVAAKMDGDGKQKAEWIERFLTLLSEHTAEDAAILASVTETIRARPGWKVKKIKQDDTANLDAVTLPIILTPKEALNDKPSKTASSTLPYTAPLPEPDNHPELTRWSLKDLDLALAEGDISRLILCLSSQHSSVRTQAFTQLSKLAYSLPHHPNLPNVQQITLLVGELLETFTQQYKDQNIALPYLAGCFATRALDVLMNPAHIIYPKLNRYLIRGPEWRVSKMPGYWLSNTLTSIPEEDDGYWKEVQWVLDWLVDGLRTTEDLEILRRGGVFEKVFALAGSSPGVRKSVGEKVGELVYRAGLLDGGAEVLVKRCGVLTWLEMSGEVEGRLREWILERCEGVGVVLEWSGGMIGANEMVQAA